MCGIAGVLSLGNAESIQMPSVYSMTRNMIHRGPDGEGYVLVRMSGQVIPLRGTDTPLNTQGDRIPFYPSLEVEDHLKIPSCLAMGHRRLSILDLSLHGHQPMSTPDRRFWIVYNGEIYNYREIGAELAAEGFQPRGHSDTEILLNAYVHWGQNCLHRLNGDFAFAIWDNHEKTLFCARDRLGIKPFYYTVQDNLFLFASDIKTIIASGLYEPKPDLEGLYLSMAFGIAPRPLTAFKDVAALKPGCCMRIGGAVGGGHTDIQQYWRIPVGSLEENMDEEEAAALLEERLKQAVRRRLVADVPVGTFMSGGIDSTTVSAMAAGLYPNINAFTLGYEETSADMDEVPQAVATAKMYTMKHTIHRVFPDETLQYLNEMIAGYEEPFYGLAPNYIISKKVKDSGITVILNGLGGDELFAGYRRYNLISTWKRIRHFALMGRWLGPRLGRRGRMLQRLSLADTPDRLHTCLFAKFNDTELKSLFDMERIKELNLIEKIHSMYAKGEKYVDEIEAMSMMDIRNYISNHHLHRVDQFGMAHSIEARFPFLDHEVVELAFRMPSSLKIRNGIQKYILRKVAKRYIAPECLSMGKKGFRLPLKRWMQHDLKPLIIDSLQALKQRECVNPKAIDRFYSEYRKGKRTFINIWHLVSLELWFKSFIDPGRTVV